MEESEVGSQEEVAAARDAVAAQLDLDSVESVDLQRLQREDDYVRKFFRHTLDLPGDPVENAVNMMVNTLKWRKDFGAGSIRESDFPPEMLEKASLFSHNRDKDGRKLLVFCVWKHIKGTDKMEDMKKFFVYYLERLNREEHGEQITVMFDCRNAGLKNMDMEFIQFIISTMKDYYPDPLNYILVFEMPWVLNAAFKVIKAWLPPAAVKKIKFLTKSNMGEYVSEDNRLEEWGGTDTWQYAWQPETQEAAFEDARDEVKKKTVTFASSIPSLAQSPSVDSVASLAVSQAGTGSGQPPQAPPDILHILSGQEVMFSVGAGGELQARVQLQNVSSQTVGFKIKTTSPEKYRVKPSTGCLQVGAAATVEIHVSGGQTGATNLARDKFLISVVLLEQELAGQQLTEALKSGRPDGQYRLRCGVAGQEPDPATPGSTLTKPRLEGLEGRAGDGQLAGLVKKVDQVAAGQQQLAQQLRTCFVLQCLILLLGLAWLLYTILYPSSCEMTDTREGGAVADTLSQEVPTDEL